MTAVAAGRVGRPHGRDGSFWVDRADHSLPVDTEVELGGRRHTIVRRDGTDDRPLVRVSGVDERSAAAALRGEPLMVEQALGEGEWLADDLVGCLVEGLGTVRRVIAAPSCDLLEIDDETLVPLVSDAVRRVDVEAKVIEPDLRFLGR